ncbi:MAG TPA: hypothetical protein VM537_37020, partial [Anaerolineae bacterium]|nr:hypothetical protein [Anaerolineae bacterium]
ALTFMEWDGSPLTIQSSYRHGWRSEAWAQTLWFVARKSTQAEPWPMRYVRPHLEGFELGLIPDRDKDSQDIVGTYGSCAELVGYCHVSWEKGSFNVWHPGLPKTASITAPICEVGLYLEGCVFEVEIKRGGIRASILQDCPAHQKGSLQNEEASEMSRDRKTLFIDEVGLVENGFAIEENGIPLTEGKDYTLDHETGQITYLTDEATALLDPHKDLRLAWTDFRRTFDREFEQSRPGRFVRWLVDWLERWLERRNRR